MIPPFSFLEEKVIDNRCLQGWIKERPAISLVRRDSFNFLLSPRPSLQPLLFSLVPKSRGYSIEFLQRMNSPLSGGERDLMIKCFYNSFSANSQNPFWESWYPSFWISEAWIDFFLLVPLCAGITFSAFFISLFSVCFPTVDMFKPLPSLAEFVHIFYLYLLKGHHIGLGEGTCLATGGKIYGSLTRLLTVLPHLSC